MGQFETTNVRRRPPPRVETAITEHERMANFESVPVAIAKKGFSFCLLLLSLQRRRRRRLPHVLLCRQVRQKLSAYYTTKCYKCL